MRVKCFAQEHNTNDPSIRSSALLSGHCVSHSLEEYHYVIKVKKITKQRGDIIQMMSLVSTRTLHQPHVRGWMYNG